ncbi:MAG: CRISPR-associated protein Cas4 [Spirosomaceae bacterium]|jgi:CRISPR-associated exonuclease Cas4|nr:CRISPR-associated protein Cas4 [Spirosomataceae bacterium]
MFITATLVNYLMLCHRKVWLHANGILMEHTSDLVSEGKLIGQESYPQRAERWTEIEVSAESSSGVRLAAKIDFFDPNAGIVHEVKKSDAKEAAHVAQVQFYLYVLRLNQIKAEYGWIEYPKLRSIEKVTLTEEDQQSVERKIRQVSEIINQEDCPEKLPISKCKSCSFFEFCWVGEE